MEHDPQPEKSQDDQLIVNEVWNHSMPPYMVV